MRNVCDVCGCGTTLRVEYEDLSPNKKRARTDKSQTGVTTLPDAPYELETDHDRLVVIVAVEVVR